MTFNVGENSKGRRVNVDVRSLRLHLQINNAASNKEGWLVAKEPKEPLGHFMADFDPQDKPESGVAQKLKRVASGVAKGVTDATKAMIAKGVDQRVIDARRAVCTECEHNLPCLLNTKRCCGGLADALNDVEPTCGCILNLKTKRWGERCPTGKW